MKESAKLIRKKKTVPTTKTQTQILILKTVKQKSQVIKKSQTFGISAFGLKIKELMI